jgi:hypothetical protein
MRVRRRHEDVHVVSMEKEFVRGMSVSSFSSDRFSTRRKQTPHGSVSEHLSTCHRAEKEQRRRAATRAQRVRAMREHGSSAAFASAEHARLCIEEQMPALRAREPVSPFRRACPTPAEERAESACMYLFQCDCAPFRTLVSECVTLLLHIQQEEQNAISAPLCEGYARWCTESDDADLLLHICQSCAPARDAAFARSWTIPFLLRMVAGCGVPSRAMGEALLPVLCGMMREGNESETLFMSLVHIAGVLDACEPLVDVLRHCLCRPDLEEYAFEMMTCLVRASNARADELVRAVNGMECALRACCTMSHVRDADVRAAALACVQSFLQWPSCRGTCDLFAVSRGLISCVETPVVRIRQEALDAVRVLVEHCALDLIFFLEKERLHAIAGSFITDPCLWTASCALDIIGISLRRTEVGFRSVRCCADSALLSRLVRGGMVDKLSLGCQSPFMDICQRSSVLLHSYFFAYCDNDAADKDLPFGFGDDDAVGQVTF